MRSGVFVLAIVAWIAGCGPGYPVWSAQAFKDPSSVGIKRASFEMECPENQLQVTELGKDSASVGVTGCGKKAVFVYLYGSGWVNNSAAPEKNR